MKKIEQYDAAFVENFMVEEKMIAKLEYQSIPAWDSVGHMALMAALEEAFDIELDVDDIIDFSSYQKGKEILGKYGIKLS